MTLQLPPHWRWKLDRWRERLAGLFGSEKHREPKPRLCPACHALVGATAEKCHECGASMTFSVAAVSRSLSEALPAESPVTYVLLAMNVFLFAVCTMATFQATRELDLFGGPSWEVLFRMGARHTGQILQGEWWRLVLPMFLHAGLIHIGMNMFMLIDLGPELEEVYGSARYLFFYMLAGVVGSLAGTAWDLVRLAIFVPIGSEEFRRFASMGFGISIGASGAIMGLLGLMLGITARRGGAYARALRYRLVRAAIFILLIGILVQGIDNAAHVGGLAAGWLLGKFSADRQPMNARERNRAFALGWLSGLAAVGSFVALAVRLFSASS